MTHFVMLSLDNKLIYAEGFPDFKSACECITFLKHGVVVKGAELTITNDADVVDKAKEVSRNVEKTYWLVV